MDVDLIDALEMLEEFDELDYIVSGVTHPDEPFGPVRIFDCQALVVSSHDSQILFPHFYLVFASG